MFTRTISFPCKVRYPCNGRRHCYVDPENKDYAAFHSSRGTYMVQTDLQYSPTVSINFSPPPSIYYTQRGLLLPIVPVPAREFFITANGASRPPSSEYQVVRRVIMSITSLYSRPRKIAETLSPCFDVSFVAPRLVPYVPAEKRSCYPHESGSGIKILKTCNIPSESLIRNASLAEAGNKHSSRALRVPRYSRFSSN